MAIFLISAITYAPKDPLNISVTKRTAVRALAATYQVPPALNEASEIATRGTFPINVGDGRVGMIVLSR